MISDAHSNLQAPAPQAVRRIQRTLMVLALAIAGMTLATGSRGQDSSANRYQPKQSTQVPPMRVEVVDGVRVRDIETGKIYRLFGIDACAPAQTAMLGRQPWPCGTVAIAWLVNATLNKWLTCAPIREQEGEQVARCATASHLDLSAGMLKEGLAVAVPAAEGDPAIRAYFAAEEQARKAFRGLWSSTFQMPWNWRGEHGDHRKSAKSGQAAR
jgi:endonuclease YncB( thermonuclease family)